tara:strand:- start:66 stop:365 length:300 start_codon:yes stop_codon:yes gene_type:complete
MLSHVEMLMRNSASTYNGWTKTTTPNNEVLRSISIGSQKNCNQDGLICDNTTETKIKNVMEKYKILDYKLNNIHTDNVFATQVLIREDIYNQLTNKLNN